MQRTDERMSNTERELAIYREDLKNLYAKNKELLEAEEGTFLHSPTYLQMIEQIRVLNNAKGLSEMHEKKLKHRIEELVRALVNRDEVIRKLRSELEERKQVDCI